jgi:hypothetical protein
MIGFDDHQKVEFIKRKVNAAKPLVDAITHPAMPKQVGLHLLRQCVPAKFGYYARTFKPAVSTPGLQQAEEMINAAISKILDIEAPSGSVAQRRFSLPVRNGGVGIRSPAFVASAAFLAATATAAPRLSNLLVPERKTGTEVAVEEAHAELKERGVEASDQFPLEAADMWRLAISDGARLQAAYTAELELAVLRDLTRRDARLRAIISSASGPGASRWISALAPALPLRMTNAQVVEAFRFLLDLPTAVDTTMGRVCICGDPIGDLHHYHTCMRAASGSWTVRHNYVVEVLQRYLTEAGLTPLREEPFHETADLSQFCKPDLAYVVGGNLVFLDVSITHPAAGSAVARASRRAGAAAREREQEKLRRYTAAQRLHHATVVPFVLETYGAMGRMAQKCVRRIARYAADYAGKSYRPFLAGMIAEIAMALQRGNGRVIEQGRNCVRAGAARRRE